MSDVFISYSRSDKDFAGKLREALADKKQDVWIDWASIPPSQAWWDEIQKGIAKANNFVVILSPNSMASPICHMEIEYARQLGKRIIPVLYLNYDRPAAITSIATRLAKPEEDVTRKIWGNRQPHDLFDANESDLKPINYFFFKPEDNFAARFEELFTIIRTDYAHKEQHTTLELRATEWQRRGRDASFLLLDNELEHAQTWLENAEGKEPLPTALHHEYIQASERRTRQLRNIRRASVIGSTVAVVAILVAMAASVIGTQAVNDANQQLGTATFQQGLAQVEAQNANNQVATATRQFATAEIAQQQAATQVQEGQATLAVVSTQVVVAEATVTQAAIIQDITAIFANAMLQQNNSPSAQLGAMDALVKRYPDQAIAYQTRGLVYAEQQQYVEAIRDYDIAIELDPELVAVYLNRGNAKSDLGDLEGALTDYDTAIELDPEYAEVYSNRGVVKSGLGDLEGALTDYDTAIELNPELAEAYSNRGTLKRDQGDLGGALTDYNRAIELDPEYALAYTSRGVAYLLSGKPDLAIIDATQAIQLGDHDAYVLRAVMYFMTNEPALSLADFEQFLALGGEIPPNFQEIYEGVKAAAGE